MLIMKGHLYYCSTLLFLLFPSLVLGGGDKVLLTQVKTLTLSEGAMTTGRRASRTSQLSRTGGSAPWGLEPRSVQCYNRGHDGMDVQWECKADLDSSVELGRIEVTCEGYDYPDDPYILKGSCGLEYSLENRRGGGGASAQSPYSGEAYKKSKGFNFADTLVMIVMALVCYAVYRTCVSSRSQEDRSYSSTNDDYHSRGGGGGWSNPGSGSSGNSNSYTDWSTHDNPSCHRRETGGGYGGFWTGLGMGGLLGYMMNGGGRQRRDPVYGGGYGNRGSSFFGGSSGTSYSGGGTHSSSGFGGTRRR